jgi:hypothetical protein
VGICCLWPGLYFGIVWGILAIIRGTKLLGENWAQYQPRALVIMQIIQVVNLDIVNVVMGIIGLVFLNDDKVKSAFIQPEP